MPPRSRTGIPVVARAAAMWPYQAAKQRKHARRELADKDHIVPEPARPNRLLLGHEGWVEELHAKISDLAHQNYAEEIEALQRNRRPGEAEARALKGLTAPWRASQGGPLREILLTADHAWFDAAGDALAARTAAGFPSLGEEKLEVLRSRGKRRREDLFMARARDFLVSQFGDAVLHARADLDESACHIHAVICITTEKTSARRGRQVLLQPSAHPLLKQYEQLQDAAGDFFERIGLQRGAARRQDRRLSVGIERMQCAAEGRPFDVSRIPKKLRRKSVVQWRAEMTEDLARQRDEHDAQLAQEALELGFDRLLVEGALVAAEEASADASRARQEALTDRQAAARERSAVIGIRKDADVDRSAAEADRLAAERDRSAAARAAQAAEDARLAEAREIAAARRQRREEEAKLQRLREKAAREARRLAAEAAEDRKAAASLRQRWERRWNDLRAALAAGELLRRADTLERSQNPVAGEPSLLPKALRAPAERIRSSKLVTKLFSRLWTDLRGERQRVTHLHAALERRREGLDDWAQKQGLSEGLARADDPARKRVEDARSSLLPNRPRRPQGDDER